MDCCQKNKTGQRYQKSIDIIANKGGTNGGDGKYHSIETQVTHQKINYKHTKVIMMKDWKEDYVRELLNSIKIKSFGKVLPTTYYIIGKHNLLKSTSLIKND